MKIKSIPTILIIFALFLSACDKLTENLKLVVDTDLIKYTAMIQVRDATNNGAPPPAGTKITISGADAENIYQVSGKRNFKLVAGIITIGPGPADSVTASNSAECVVTISANGYETVTKKIVFTADVKQQLVDLQIKKIGQPAQELPPLQPAVGNPKVQVQFIGTCTNNSDLEIRPSVYLFYRLAGSGDVFNYLGFMEKGSLTTEALEQNKNYEFQITYDNNAYQASKLIDGNNFLLTINMGKACSNF